MVEGAVGQVFDDGSLALADRIALEISLHLHLAEHHARQAASARAAWEAYEAEIESVGELTPVPPAA
jgi:hypothetical protein